MKDLIIGAIANYTPDKIKIYINSINKCGFDGDKIMIVYNVPNETVDFLQNNGWMVYGGQLVGHPHMHRLIDMFQLLTILKEQGAEYRYVITTDVRDVVFQTNPSEFIDSHLNLDILASSENVTYENEPWGKKNILEGYNDALFQRYKHELICNVGVLAGRFNAMCDLLLLNYLVSQSGNTQHYTDQSSFNFVIHNRLVNHRIQIEDISSHWAMQSGTLDNAKFIGKTWQQNIELRNGVLYNGTQPFVIVHQYDRIPKWKDEIEKKYS
jgi:hypothetical protein